MPYASAAQVRKFAAEQGFEGTRGRIPQWLIDAFNKGRRARDQYVEGLVPMTRKVTATRVVNGRKVRVTQKVRGTEVRAAALAAGIKVPSRGRVPKVLEDAYVAGLLMPLSEAATV